MDLHTAHKVLRLCEKGIATGARLSAQLQELRRETEQLKSLIEDARREKNAILSGLAGLTITAGQFSK